jgi:hypothetical protein
MMRWTKVGVVAVAFLVTIYATSYFSRLPESNCTTSEVLSISSADHLFKATLLLKECNIAETVFYSVRVEKAGGATDRGWFLIAEIEQDPYPARPSEPRLRWHEHKLGIEIPAKAYKGFIERRVQDDLTIVRSYVAANP